MSEKAKNYADFRAAIMSYAAPETGKKFTLESFADGLLEYLVCTERLNPNEFEGWPEDGLVAPLLSDAKEAAVS